MPTKVLTFAFNAAGSQSWVADQDYVLSAVFSTSTGGNAMVSTDPSLAITDITAAAAKKIIFDLLWFSSTAARQPPSAQIPIAEGSTLYVVSGAVLSVLLYLELPAQLK